MSDDETTTKKSDETETIHTTDEVVHTRETLDFDETDPDNFSAQMVEQDLVHLAREATNRIKEHVLPELSGVIMKRLEIEVRRAVVLAYHRAEEHFDKDVEVTLVINPSSRIIKVKKGYDDDGGM